MKKHEEQFSQMEYQWIMAIGSLIVAVALLVSLYTTIDFSPILDPKVVISTIVMAILTILFVRFNIRLTQTADRSFASQFSVLTIPVMMIADVVLWYSITPLQMGIMAAITLIFIIQNRGIRGNSKDIPLALGCVITWVVSMILFKYTTSHWLSMTLQIFLSAFCNVTILVFWKHNELLTLIRRRKDRAVASRLALFHGASSLLCSYALSFGIASIVVTIKRVTQLIRSLIFSKVVFHEHHMLRKSIITWLLALCLITMQLPVIMPAFAQQ
jgi:drug/metabolite transporter (DMT)-like permease